MVEGHEKNGHGPGQVSRLSAEVFFNGDDSEEDDGPITFRRSSAVSKSKTDLLKCATENENAESNLAKSQPKPHVNNLVSMSSATVSFPINSALGSCLAPTRDSEFTPPTLTSILHAAPSSGRKVSISSTVPSENNIEETVKSVLPNPAGPEVVQVPSLAHAASSSNSEERVSGCNLRRDLSLNAPGNQLRDASLEKGSRLSFGAASPQFVNHKITKPADDSLCSQIHNATTGKAPDKTASVTLPVGSTLNHEDIIEFDADEDKPLSTRLANCSLVSRQHISAMKEPSSLSLESPKEVLGEEQNSSSEDDKPLSGRLMSFTTATTKQLIMEGVKRNESYKHTNDKMLKLPKLPSTKDTSDDSDDDKPLSQRLNPRNPVNVSGSISAQLGLIFADKKPSKRMKLESASTKFNEEEGIAAISLKKRPHEQSLSNIALSDVKKVKTFHETGKLQVNHKRQINSDDDDVPLSKRILPSITPNKPVTTKKVSSGMAMATKKLLEARRARTGQIKKVMKTKSSISMLGQPKGAPVSGGAQKWTTLEHNGVIFPPPYQAHGIKMLYDGRPVGLTPEQEEVATMFAVMKDTDYATKPKFISNFWNDWKQILGPKHAIKKLELCDFTPIYEWHLKEKEKKKSMSPGEKKRIKEEKLKHEEKYMWALVDGVKEKVGNFRVEPPGLFRGRGEHPKMGKLKKRIFPENIVINVGKDAPVPDCPMPGHRWKDVRHDNTVTWLAYWNDPINSKEFKYVFLAPSSSLKGQSDREKYEKSRKLKDYIEDIRKTYTKGFSSSDSTRRQIAVATYLIDRLALRAGNEKDDDEADTVGCCSLKVEHVSLIPPRSLEFDFLGKDSIRYFNTVEVDERVYKAIGAFRKSKTDGDDLFDKLDTGKLNAHLKEIMPGLTAKVFRTYNASITLDTQLQSTNGSNVTEKIAAYQGANKEVAILCNHQRSVSKSHSAQMERLEAKMAELEALRAEIKRDLDRAKKGKSPSRDADGKLKKNQTSELLLKRLEQTDQKIDKVKLDMRIKDDLKTVALGTSKINYMDPRITVAWCKRHEVPIEKIFNKSLLAKFSWAMDVEPYFRF